MEIRLSAKVGGNAGQTSGSSAPVVLIRTNEGVSMTSNSSAGINLPPRLLGLVLGVVGIILTPVFVWVLVDTLIFRASAIHAEGEVTRIDWTEARANEASIAHTVVQIRDGERAVEIRSGVGSSSPTHAVGEKVVVLYPPGKPQEGRIDSFVENYLGLILSGVFGPALLVVGGMLFFRGLRQDIAEAREVLSQLDNVVLNRHQRALTEGTAVQAKVALVRPDEAVTVDGRHPWVIVAEHWDEAIGRKLTFASEPIWFDPKQYYTVGSDVKVCYLPEDPSVYAVVLDRIPD